MIAMLFFAAAAATADPGCAARIAAARPAIEHANSDFLRALQARDAAAIAEPYAEDGVFVRPDGAALKGRAAIEAQYAKTTAQAAASIVGGGVETKGLGCGDDGMVIEWGGAVLRQKGADGAVHERGGPYLTVWKQIGGTWRIIRNVAF